MDDKEVAAAAYHTGQIDLMRDSATAAWKADPLFIEMLKAQLQLNTENFRIDRVR